MPCHISGWRAICPSRLNVPFATKRVDRCSGESFLPTKFLCFSFLSGHHQLVVRFFVYYLHSIFFFFLLLSQWWRRLQDWRCLWCRAMVHTACRPQYPVRCPLGPCRVSIVPPTALHSVGAYTHGYYDGRRKSKQKGKLGQIHTQHARFACPRLICTDTHANMATTPLIVVKKKKKNDWKKNGVGIAFLCWEPKTVSA